METAKPRQAPGEFFTVDGTFLVTAMVTSIGQKGRHLWRKPKKKGSNSQLFMRNGEEHIYLHKIELICLPHLSNTITPIIG